MRVLGMLSHPNIISYYDSFDEDGTLWIEMEYADGGYILILYFKILYYLNWIETESSSKYFPQKFVLFFFEDSF